MDERIIREPLCTGQATVTVEEIRYRGFWQETETVTYAAGRPGIVILLTGQGEWTRHGQYQTVEKNQYFAVGTGSETTFWAHKGTELLFLVLLTGRTFSGDDTLAYTVPTGLGRQSLAAIQKEISKRSPGYEAACKRYAQIFLLELSRYGRMPTCFCPKEQDAIAQDIREYIDGHFREKILITEIMERNGLSRAEINQAFYDAYGCTPMQYYHQRRVQEGKRLLEQTDMPIREIAKRIGFCSNSHFVPAFKKYMKITPHQYRRQYRERKARKMQEENRQMELSDYLTG